MSHPGVGLLLLASFAGCFYFPDPVIEEAELDVPPIVRPQDVVPDTDELIRVTLSLGQPQTLGVLAVRDQNREDALFFDFALFDGTGRSLPGLSNSGSLEFSEQDGDISVYEGPQIVLDPCNDDALNSLERLTVQLTIRDEVDNTQQAVELGGVAEFSQTFSWNLVFEGGPCPEF
ncbi:MAG: hypothetical protein KC561_20085 [Myxococcales bacterium]|nr:hypothetical protein [Myxococcales bacterium]